MQYSGITEILQEKNIPLEKTMRKARIPGFCQATVDKNGILATPHGYTDGCGLLKMASDPTKIPFGKLSNENLEFQDAIILYSDELFFADQRRAK